MGGTDVEHRSMVEQLLPVLLTITNTLWRHVPEGSKMVLHKT